MTIVGITLFLLIDMMFFGANIEKILQGGWFPLVIAVALFTLMATWKSGRSLLYERLSEISIKLTPFIEALVKRPPQRIAGTAVFLTSGKDAVPHAMLHNLKHNKVLHKRVIILNVRFQDIPFVPDEHRIYIDTYTADFYRIRVNYGFKDQPDIPRALALCAEHGIDIDIMDTSFFLSRETIITTERPGMARWRKKLFTSMARNATSITAYFNIPTNRVIELGTQVEL